MFLNFNGQDCLDNKKRRNRMFCMVNVYLLIIRLLLMQIKSVNAFEFMRVQNKARLHASTNLKMFILLCPHFHKQTLTSDQIYGFAWICAICEKVEHHGNKNGKFIFWLGKCTQYIIKFQHIFKEDCIFFEVSDRTLTFMMRCCQ